jgi:hypothetical protein
MSKTGFQRAGDLVAVHGKRGNADGPHRPPGWVSQEYTSIPAAVLMLAYAAGDGLVTRASKQHGILGGRCSAAGSSRFCSCTPGRARHGGSLSGSVRAVAAASFDAAPAARTRYGPREVLHVLRIVLAVVQAPVLCAASLLTPAWLAALARLGNVLLRACGPGGAAGSGRIEDPVPAGGPAQEPAAARVRCAAVGVEAAAGDDVGQPVGHGLEPGLEVLVTGGLHLAAQPCQGLGLGGRRAQAEEVDGLPPCVGGVLDRLQLGPPGWRPLLQGAGEPGERLVGEFGCQGADAVAQAECVGEDREVVGGEDLALLQDGPVDRGPAAGSADGLCLAGAGFT